MSFIESYKKGESESALTKNALSTTQSSMQLGTRNIKMKDMTVHTVKELNEWKGKK